MADLFVKLYKKMLDWEWYQDVNTKVLFLHCLLKAEWYSGSWQGIHYEPGQFITSLPRLSKETGLTIQQVRTALKHLISTGELTDHQQANARVITVLKWNEYQSINRQLTDDQQTANRQLTACKEYKNNKNKRYKRAREKKSDTDYDALAKELMT